MDRPIQPGLLPFLLSAIFYNNLPAKDPSHRDSHGNVNSYMPRFLAAFGIPLSLFVIQMIVTITLDHNPKQKNIPPIKRTIGKFFVPAAALISRVPCCGAYQSRQIPQCLDLRCLFVHRQCVG